jgi:hypothetical protein
MGIKINELEFTDCVALSHRPFYKKILLFSLLSAFYVLLLVPHRRLVNLSAFSSK